MRAAGRVGRYLVPGLAVLLLAGVVSTVSPDPAVAQTPPTPIERIAAGTASDAEYNAYWRAVIRGAVTPGEQAVLDGLGAADRGRIASALYRARMAARVVPGFSAAGLARIGLVGLGAYVGWRVYQHYSGGSTAQVDMWLDSDSLGKNALFNPCAVPFGGNKSPCILGWSRTGADRSCDSESSAFNSGYSCESGAAWVYSTVSGSTTNESCYPASAPCWVLHLSPVAINADTWNGTLAHTDYFANFWSGDYGWKASSAHWDYDSLAAYGDSGLDCQYGNQSQAGYDWVWPRQLGYTVAKTMDNMESRWPGRRYVVSTNCGGGRPDSHQDRMILQPSDLDDAVSLKSDAALVTPDVTSDYTVPSPYTSSPTSPGSSSDKSNSVAVLEEDECVTAYVNAVVSPSTYYFDGCADYGSIVGAGEGEPIALPQPELNETYPAYRARLRAAGFLGSIYQRVWSEADAVTELQAGAVTQVEDGAPWRTGVAVYEVLDWPATDPLLDPAVSLTVRTNPLESDPTTGTGSDSDLDDATGTAPPPGDVTGASCDCPPVDFSPITDADLGGKFPFAVITWVGTWLGALVSDPDAPVFDFTNPTYWGDTHYTVDLEVLDSYMATIRTLLSWCIWVGAVWWFGTRLLGFRHTGDPGAAVDDAW